MPALTSSLVVLRKSIPPPHKQQLQNVSAFVHAVLDSLTGREINFLKRFPVVTASKTLNDLVEELQDCVRQCTAKALTEEQV